MSDFDSDPDSDSDSDSESDSDSNTAFINLDMYIFFFYTCILLNKPADNFFFILSHYKINPHASNASIINIFVWHFITQKVCFYYAVKFSYFGFYVFLP